MQLTLPIHVSWQVQEEPKERYLTSGVEALSDRELVGLVLDNQELAQALFATFGSLQKIRQASGQELQTRCSLSKEQTRVLQTAFALSSRLHIADQRPTVITSSDQAAIYLQTKIGNEAREIFYVLYLTPGHAIIAEESLFTGGTTSTIVDPKLVFKQAINHLASSIIVAHNHPSGRTQPSKADIQITEKLVSAGKLLNIRVLDHLIVSSTDYYSFVDEGLIEE